MLRWKKKGLLFNPKNKLFVLNFSAPRSRICSEVVTQDERRFMASTKRVPEGNFRQTVIKGGVRQPAN